MNHFSEMGLNTYRIDKPKIMLIKKKIKVLPWDPMPLTETAKQTIRGKTGPSDLLLGVLDLDFRRKLELHRAKNQGPINMGFPIRLRF